MGVGTEVSHDHWLCRSQCLSVSKEEGGREELAGLARWPLHHPQPTTPPLLPQASVSGFSSTEQQSVLRSIQAVVVCPGPASYHLGVHVMRVELPAYASHIYMPSFPKTSTLFCLFLNCRREVTRLLSLPQCLWGSGGRWQPLRAASSEQRGLLGLLGSRLC